MSKYKLFDRSKIKFKSVNERLSKLRIEEIAVSHLSQPPKINWPTESRIKGLASAILKARLEGKPVVLCMGAHPIKNGACNLINELVNRNLITHVATNGAGAIHDWEFAKFGKSTECVRTNVAVGEFGIWEETGVFFGLSAQLALEEDKGWGEKMGELMYNNISFVGGRPGNSYKCREYSVMLNCYKRNIPFTIHPGIGQDIVYAHQYVDEDVGCSINDFLIFCESIRKLDGGIYLSVGSSVMSPMIFEKALSMSRNVEGPFDDFVIAVNDLSDSNWDWSQGEPPIDSPAYYIRFMKSFHRMGGELQYYGIHNIDFLHNLCASI